LRDGVSDMKGAREFLSSNRWHPISRAGREKFERLDAQAWLKAASDGTSKALLDYIREAEGKPEGPNLANARRMLDRAEQVAGVQRSLARLQYYRGQVNGRYDLATKSACDKSVPV
jgi:hypothetical protein